jgi:hypothetical protein
MKLPPSASYSQAAFVLMNCISSQTSPPSPDELPRKIEGDRQEPQEP